MDEVGAKTEEIIKDYNAGKLDVKTTADGLKYVILTEGDGPSRRKQAKALLSIIMEHSWMGKCSIQVLEWEDHIPLL